MKYNLSTEELDVFVPDGSGGSGGTSGLAFGPDGDLYVTRYGSNSVFTGELDTPYPDSSMGGSPCPGGHRS